MDDTQFKTQNVNPTTASGSNGQSDSGQAPRQAQDSARMTTQPIVQQPVQPPVQQPTQPVGGPKEAPVATAPVTEWVSASTPEVVLPQEVKEAGVEAKPVVEVISADAQKSGVRMANSAMAVPTVSEETVSLDTPASVLQQLKKMHKKVSDSFSWLVRLIIKEQDKRASTKS